MWHGLHLLNVHCTLNCLTQRTSPKTRISHYLWLSHQSRWNLPIIIPLSTSSFRLVEQWMRWSSNFGTHFFFRACPHLGHCQRLWSCCRRWSVVALFRSDGRLHNPKNYGRTARRAKEFIDVEDILIIGIIYHRWCAHPFGVTFPPFLWRCCSWTTVTSPCTEEAASNRLWTGFTATHSTIMMVVIKNEMKYMLSLSRPRLSSQNATETYVFIRFSLEKY